MEIGIWLHGLEVGVWTMSYISVETWDSVHSSVPVFAALPLFPSLFIFCGGQSKPKVEHLKTSQKWISSYCSG